jgi:hypothetical protein
MSKSNGIQKSPAQLIGETPELVTDEQYEKALKDAGLDDDEELKLTRVLAVSAIGRHRTQQKGGFIVGGAEISIVKLARASEVLLGDVETGATAVERAQSADSMAKIEGAINNARLLQMKGMEQVAFGSAKDGQKGRAPSQITGMEINAENVQIVQGPQTPQEKPAKAA